MKCLAYYLDRLRNTPEGDGTLLDHSLILYGTNMGDSNQHLHYDVPHILVGGASGQLKGDRHLVHDQDHDHRQSAVEHSWTCTGFIRTASATAPGRLPGLV